MTAAAFTQTQTPTDPAQFAVLLEGQKSRIARHTLAAWDGESADQINHDLRAAKALLIRVAQAAATAGLAHVGEIAVQCAREITDHLEGDYADLAVCPGEIIWRVDGFVQACDALSAA